MFKLFFFCLLLVSSFSSFASPLEQMMTIKERLRLSLWVEGIEPQIKVKNPSLAKQQLPEEIERSLKKL